MVLAALAAISLTAGACSSGSGSKGSTGSKGAETVKVGLSEYSISPDIQSVKAGDVTFDVANEGTMAHEMVLIKTDVPPTHLPMEKGEASEAGSVGEVSDLPAGESGTLTVHLDPGHYVMICNLPGHYSAGMRTEFTVS
jgi:uncharacterized cupredoxin-like copper-binding protein